MQNLKLGKDKSDCDEVNCHLMPCRIEYKGSTVLAKQYFWPTIRLLQAGGDEDQGRGAKSDYATKADSCNLKDNPVLVASFRGRPLQGKKIQLPDGYEGTVVDEDGQKPIGKFKELTYWNWDKIPETSDTIVQSLQWFDISKAIHSNPD